MSPTEGTSWLVSTPGWTVRIDVQAGVIQDTSARYVKNAYGQAWTTWRKQIERHYGRSVTFTLLTENPHAQP